MKITPQQYETLFDALVEAIFNGFYEGGRKAGICKGIINETTFPIKGPDVLTVSNRLTSQALKELGIEK